MGYRRVLVGEARMPLGSEHLFVNPLHGVRSVHDGEEVAAYEDGDRRVRISAYALLRRPQQVFSELMQLSRGRWTHAAAALRRGYRYVRARIAGRAAHRTRAELLKTVGDSLEAGVAYGSSAQAEAAARNGDRAAMLAALAALGPRLAALCDELALRHLKQELLGR